tara:strand:+ start:223 stop:1842 length:1620 start_codon:yes stop_codon:yes gene_type:complete
MKKLFLYSLFIISGLFQLNAQDIGCNDPNACNYQAVEFVDNSNCEYATSYVYEQLYANGLPQFDASGNPLMSYQLISSPELNCNLNCYEYSLDENDTPLYNEVGEHMMQYVQNSSDNCSNVILGCTNSNACNYQENANVNDGSCQYLTVNVYQQSTYYGIPQFDANGIPIIEYGALSSSLLNCNQNCYEFVSNQDNGLLYNEVGEYIMQYIQNSIDDCSSVILGCTNSNACNYEENATVNDGSCEYVYIETYYQSYIDVTGSQVHPNTPGAIPQFNWWDGNPVIVFLSLPDPSVQCNQTQIYGCTNSSACNYQPDATNDDGSCTFAQMYYNCNGNCINDIDSDGVCDELEVTGCTDENGLNYDLNATEEDGSCSYYPSCQNLNFPSGWSMFSSYIVANSMSMSNILDPIYDNVIISKNNAGQAYLTEFNFNGIGDMLIGQGYQIKTNEYCQFDLCGTYAIPQDNSINLFSGWNLIGYLKLEPESAEIILDSLSDSGNLIILKNYLGAAYLPEFNFNGIGFMMPGQGYQIKVLNNDTLQY